MQSLRFSKLISLSFDILAGQVKKSQFEVCSLEGEIYRESARFLFVILYNQFKKDSILFMSSPSRSSTSSRRVTMQERLQLWKSKKAKKEAASATDTTHSSAAKASAILTKNIISNQKPKIPAGYNDLDTASGSGYDAEGENANPNWEGRKFMHPNSAGHLLEHKAGLLSSIESSGSSSYSSCGPTSAATSGTGTGTGTGTGAGTNKEIKKNSSRRKTLGVIQEIKSTVKQHASPDSAVPGGSSTYTNSNSSSCSSKGRKVRRASSGSSSAAATTTTTAAAVATHASAFAHYALPVSRGGSDGNGGKTQKDKALRRKSASTCTTPQKLQPKHVSVGVGVGAGVGATHVGIEALAASEFALQSSQARAEMLEAQLSDVQQALQHAQEAETAALLLQAAAEEKTKRCWDEVSAQFFINSVNEQKIEEMEIKLSHERMNCNEDGREVRRKHKTQLKQILEEKMQFEERTDTMIKELNEQMNSIQDMAMQRITQLENDLLTKSDECAAHEDAANILRSSSTAMKLELTAAAAQIRTLQIAVTQAKAQAQRYEYECVESESDRDSDRLSRGNGERDSVGTSATELVSDKDDIDDDDGDDDDEDEEEEDDEDGEGGDGNETE